MEPTTRDHILDAAQKLAQQRGFHAFSYRDIAAEVGIRGPSIHYYFQSKDDLGAALVERYRLRFSRDRAIIDRSGTARERLQRYTQLFRKTLMDGGKMCLCGMFAAEMSFLPKAMQAGVEGFFVENEGWLAEILEAGKKDKTLNFSGTSDEHAVIILATLEGSLLAARVARRPDRFDSAIATMLKGLAA
jgi:TetR/AcrR family transcriptional repressor of nem operon